MLELVTRSSGVVSFAVRGLTTSTPPFTLMLCVLRMQAHAPHDCRAQKDPVGPHVPEAVERAARSWQEAINHVQLANFGNRGGPGRIMSVLKAVQGLGSSFRCRSLVCTTSCLPAGQLRYAMAETPPRNIYCFAKSSGALQAAKDIFMKVLPHSPVVSQDVQGKEGRLKRRCMSQANISVDRSGQVSFIFRETQSTGINAPKFDIDMYIQSLATKQLGCTILAAASLPSTQTLLQQNAGQVPDGTICIVDRQEAGKGAAVCGRDNKDPKLPTALLA